MHQDQATRNSATWQIADGMAVYAADGTKVGIVQHYDPAAGYLDVRKGRVFPRDFFVPSDGVETVAEGRVVLRLDQHALADERYAAPPGTDAPAIGVGQAARDSGMMALAADTPLAGGADIRVPVREEELVVGKEAQEAGRVHVHKGVIEERQTLDVPVNRERVIVEHKPYDGADMKTEEAFTERDIDIPVMGEAVVAEKRVRGVEEIVIHKDVLTEQQQVSDTVRKERVTVDGVDQEGAWRPER